MTDWKEKLFEEKSFWELFLKARAVSGSKSNKIIIVTVFVFFSILTALNLFILERPFISSEDMYTSLNGWINYGISYSSGILGFLLTGFAVFASLTKPEVFEALANTTNKKYKISNFKFVFYNFLVVFAYYLSFLAYNVVFILLFGKYGFFRNTLSHSDACFYDMFLSFLIILTGTWFIASILHLKSFIWNLYQSVLLAITIPKVIDEIKNEE